MRRNELINCTLFGESLSACAEIGRLFQRRPGCFLTEADAACRLFSRLSRLFDEQEFTYVDGNHAWPVHACVKFLDGDGKLSYVPDICIIDPSEVTIAASG